MSALWSSLNQINSNLFPNGVDFVQDVKLMNQSKVVVTYHVNNEASSLVSTTSGNLFLHIGNVSIFLCISLVSKLYFSDTSQVLNWRVSKLISYVLCFSANSLAHHVPDEYLLVVV